MSENRNPQHEQMADESMVRCLTAQADAIWPAESKLIESYALKEDAKILDVGCGTGEFVRRFAQLGGCGTLIGVDLIEPHLEIARERCAHLGGRARFEVGDAFELAFDDGEFDFVVNRHMLQSIPRPEAIVDELLRVTQPGGRIHLLAEDYAMIHFHPVPGDSDRFWQSGPIAFGHKLETDLRIGRRAFSILAERGVQSISVEYVVVDTLRVARQTFVAIWEAWRDGYTEAIAKNTELTLEEVQNYWAAMIDCLNDPNGYAIWHVPVISGLKP